MSGIVLEKLNLKSKTHDLKEWQTLDRRIKNSELPVKIGIVGKYFSTGDFTLADSYLSVIEAIKHASYFLKRKPIITWIDAAGFDPKENRRYETTLKKLRDFNGIIVPGGFGSRAVEGKIQAIKFVRENKIPFFGLCYGLQLAIVEFSRNVLNLKDAHSSEISPRTSHPVIDILPEQKKLMAEKSYGGTMRLGAYPAVLKPNTIAQTAYSAGRHSEPRGAGRRISRRHSESERRISPVISERHRHRYEVNPDYIGKLEKQGLIFSGTSKDRRLMEIAELPRDKHPFFLGTQFHPELKSRPLNPHPLFLEFIRASIKK